MLNVFSLIAAFETSFKCLSTGKMIKLVMFYYRPCSDFVFVVPASSQQCDVQWFTVSPQ